MATTRILRVGPDSELSALLHDALASDDAVLVDTGDTVYRIQIRLDNEASTSNVADNRHLSSAEIERSRAGITEAAGSWRDIDAEGFKAYIRERRRTSGRPPIDL